MVDEKRLQEFRKEVKELQELWYALLPTHSIPEAQFSLWLARYGHSISRHGIEQAALKYQKKPSMTTEHLAKFSSAVMRDFRKMLEQEEK